MKLNLDIVVDAPREAVWDAIVDPARRHRWQADLSAMEAVSGEPGAVGFVARRVDRQGEAIGLESVSESRRPDFVAFIVEGDDCKALVVHTLTEAGDGTRWQAWSNTAFRGLARLTALFSTGSLREQLENELQRCKLMIETDAAGGSQ
jgi:uncharacterized protein YndB with AHSA1/START domain